MKKNQTLEEDKSKIFKYYNDTRSEQEKQLTDLLVRSLSDLNFQLLNHHPPSQTPPLTPNPPKDNRKQDFLYVCINGVPPFDNQFQFLQLPGECINFAFPSFDKGLTGQQVLALRTQFIQLAHSLHRKISEASGQKPIVFIYHSFGTYVFASYCQLYPTHRIVGIIDVGGAPIRFYPALKEFLGSLWDVSLEQIQENLEEAHLIIAERNKSLGIKAYDRKEELYGVCKAFKSEPGFRQMFEYNRNFPKVLKCFIFGRKDSLFVESLINQKMVYYAYQNKLDEAYATSLQGAYQQCFGRKCKNVQERFIYSYERGHHSVHMQKKYRQLNAKIVNHYLTFLEELHSGKYAKL